MKRNIASFALIEILIIISIIVLLTGLSLATYNNFTQEKNLEKESQKLVDVLELAKAKTMSNDSSQCSPPTITPQVNYYSVSVPNSTTYQLNPTCLTGTPVPVSYRVESNVSFNNSPQTIQFNKLSGGANSGCIKLQTGAACRYVNVSNLGVIEEGKLADCSTPCP